MDGAEYLTPDVLAALWADTERALAAELADFDGTVQDFFKARHAAWNLVGRVHFNLAEHRGDDAAPFAFLATYTPRLSQQGRAQHQPLGQALREYAGAANNERLLGLLVPVQRAAERCDWLARMVDSGEVFHPLRFTPDEAFQLLGDAPALEQSGVIVRLPAAWRGGRPARPVVTGTVGSKPASGLGAEALLDFRAEVTLGGETLTAAEVEALLAGSDGLAFIRGQWVEVDRRRLERTLERFAAAQRLAAERGLVFADAMRLLAGADAPDGDGGGPDAEWSQIGAGPWLAEILAGLRSPQQLRDALPGSALRTQLRPYQETGVRWLRLLTRLGLGACLADDMGLGKTVQVLGLLLCERRDEPELPPSLLVAPASLLANWAAEIERFAPSLRVLVAHPSVTPPAELAALSPEALAGLDLVITSFGSLRRAPALQATRWHLAIVDEAQAIKNPGAQQTRAVKKLTARARLALTGTPIENRVGDLWSIFDFINPGLLGSGKEFTRYTKALADQPTAGSGRAYGPLRRLVQPYILRRLKTDPTVISDLPQKTEVKAYCTLSRKQAALYQQAVKELRHELGRAAGVRRRGVVLASLTRLKQICNHPSQWLGDGAWHESDSGKLARLREIAEVIAAKQEKVLVFTQFREVTAPLAAFLGGVFGRPGLVLHGQIAVAKRRALVQRFCDEDAVPFFVLSLKAGGAGLNLTAASHVVHFDRWWNPAVEDQATDRAFRIGQRRNVLVHKLVCQGTVEEKIDALIAGKRTLSEELLAGGAEVSLTELDDRELLALVALDLKAAMRD